MPTEWLFDDDSEVKMDQVHRERSVRNSKSEVAKSKPAYPGANPENPLRVSDLNAWVKTVIDRSIPRIWIEGEITDLSRPQSGHAYLTLKDPDSQVRAVIWRSTMARVPFRLEDGQSVLCQGSVDVYSARGSYQFVIQQIQPKGVGALQLAFRQLHAKLAKEGLFDQERKKPLPVFPARIGFVTSPTGAAVHDFLEVLRRRWPNVYVLVIPVRVQGEGAAQEIAQGIRSAQQIVPKLDLLVVGRGGGSMEDLWAFNEEAVVREVAACQLPTVSAVGHEIDVTLCDLAADVRALTPSEAAERILPSAMEILEALHATKTRLDHWMTQYVHHIRRRLDQIASRPSLRNPESMTQRLSQRVDELQIRLTQVSQRHLDRAKQRVSQLASNLDALSPVRVLKRGYSVTRLASNHEVVRSIEKIRMGEDIEICLVDGIAKTRVYSTRREMWISEVHQTSDISQGIEES